LMRDNARLNSRDPRFQNRPQRVVILDPEGKCYSILKDSQLASVRKPSEIFIVTGAGVPRPPLGEQIEIADRDRSFDLADVLEQLGSLGMQSLFVEAGPLTASSFLRASLVDRLYLFLAPKLLGEGLSWTPGIRLSSLDSAIGLEQTRSEKFGDDILLTGLFRPTPSTGQ
jgi:diaminohydroxyphosphoribosylaminopyrimidine deaminase / 5-amino-6-(5-phosphoribosylamino)uracil reductase